MSSAAELAWLIPLLPLFGAVITGLGLISFNRTINRLRTPVALLLISSTSIQLVLALATIGVFLSQIRRGRRPLASLGWTLLVLSIGLAAGSLLNLALSPTAFEQLALSPLQIQALPAALLLWAAALFLA